MAGIDDLGQRIQAGIGLITAVRSRASGSGAVDETLLRAMLGDAPTQDDLITALANVLMVNEMVLWMHWKATERDPAELLRSLSAHQERGPTAGPA